MLKGVNVKKMRQHTIMGGSRGWAVPHPKIRPKELKTLKY
jgi:hypothetical protein